jgi:replicative DNA helicase
MSQYDNDTVTPYINTPAEIALLGAILLDGRYAYEQVQGIIKASDFYIPRHGYIWDAITNTVGELDFVTIASALGRIGKLADSGGDAYLTHLITSVPSSQNIAGYAKDVKRASIARTLHKTMTDTYTKITSGDDIETIIAGLSSALTTLDNPTPPKTHRERMQAYLEQRQALWLDPSIDDGISWGIPRFDRVFGLIKPQHLGVIAGQAKGGKSLLLAHLMLNMAKAGKRVALVSLEMSDYEIYDRLSEILSNVNYETARLQASTKGNWDKLVGAWNKLYQMPIALHDDSVRLSDIPRLIHQWRKDLGGLDVLIVDYAGLIEPDEPNARKAHWERMNEISVALKRLAISQKIAVLTAVQLNRDGYGRKPSMEHVSGTIGNVQNANWVLAVWREENPTLEGAFNILHMANRSRQAGQVIEMVQRGLQIHEVIRDDTRD